MDDDAAEDLGALLPPLLHSLETLRFVARHLDPQEVDALMQAAGTPDAALRTLRPRLARWPDALAEVRIALEAACDAVLAAFDGMRAAPEQEDGLRAVFRALRHVPAAQEALYPLAAGLPAVSAFFLDPALRDDQGLQTRLAQGAGNAGTGVIHAGDAPGARGGFSMYVPEDYTPDRAWPLVMALHGGSGDGRGFLWSWLRDARGLGAILVAPTATGRTWALMGEDTDTPNLARIFDGVRGRWNIDPSKLLLTGMSDGGTFAYVTGLQQGSPFTHLAPVAASFHPMLAEIADPARLRGLPIHIVHGVRDWMFPVDVARRARRALEAAGARVTYREIDDLSHCYPTEINPMILAWLRGT